MDKCNALWRMSRLPVSAEKIERITGRRLSRPVCSRWKNLFDSLSALAGLGELLAPQRGALGIKKSFTARDILYMKEYLLCCEPVAKALNKLQGEKTAFYGILLPTLLATRKKLSAIEVSQLKHCSLILNSLKQSLGRRFSDVFNIRTNLEEISAVAALTLPYFNRFFSVYRGVGAEISHGSLHGIDF